MWARQEAGEEAGLCCLALLRPWALEKSSFHINFVPIIETGKVRLIEMPRERQLENPQCTRAYRIGAAQLSFSLGFIMMAALLLWGPSWLPNCCIFTG